MSAKIGNLLMFIDPKGHSVRYWLKMVGAAGWRLRNDWLIDEHGSRTDLLDRVRFPRNKRPASISAGDRLVYYAAGVGCYFATVEVTSRGPFESGEEERWPYAMNVRPLLIVPALDAAPPLSDLRLRKGNLSVRHQSHVELTAEQYDEAVAGLARVAARPSMGRGA